MRRFTCPSCSARVFFNDVICMTCSTSLAYDPITDAMAENRNACRSAVLWDCNWLAPENGDTCLACSLDHQTSEPGPDLTAFQAAKRRVVRQLQLIGIDPTTTDPPLRFDLLRPTPGEHVTTGHADGLVTLDISEGNPAQLADVQTRLGEPYRSPLGHVRHESGHWHWQAFVEQEPATLPAFRALFGDERVDYADALQRHYDRTDDGSWRDDRISFYATAHPWEDYAESFAHVLHLQALVETAAAEGFAPDLPPDSAFQAMYHAWVPLTVSLNELARAMGTAEPYPFAPPPPAVAKMAFVHGLIRPSAVVPTTQPRLVR